MRKIPLFAATALMLPALAFAQPYAAVQAGAAFTKDMAPVEFDVGYNLSLRGGYDYGNYRLEGQAQFARSDVKGIDADVTIPAFTVNGLYDFTPWSDFHPYLGAGIGVAIPNVNVHMNNTNVSVDDGAKFAYKVMAGLEYDLSMDNAVYTSYDFMDVVNTGGDFRSHTLSVGLRHSF